MVSKGFPNVIKGQQYRGETSLYCTLTLIAMQQGHQNHNHYDNHKEHSKSRCKNKFELRVPDYEYSNMGLLEKGKVKLTRCVDETLAEVALRQLFGTLKPSPPGQHRTRLFNSSIIASAS